MEQAVNGQALSNAVAEGVKNALGPIDESLRQIVGEFRAAQQAAEGTTDESTKLAQIEAKFNADMEALREENKTLQRQVAERQAGTPIAEQGISRQIRMPLSEAERTRRPFNEAERAGQILSDQMYLLTALCRGVDTWSKHQTAEFLRNSQLVKDAMLAYPELARTITQMDTATAGSGLEWVPEGFSSEIIAAVQLGIQVPALFPHISMPTATFTCPVALTRPKAYKATQGADRTVNQRDLTAKTTFEAEPVAVYVPVTTELSEDLAVPILGWLQGSMVEGIAEGVEACILNGDTTATHMDTDIEAEGATAVETCWDGLRHYGLTTANCKVDISTFTADNVLGMKTLMKKYGINPADLVWLVGPGILNKMLLIRDSQNNLLVTTVDKYGAGATVLSGEIGRFFGIPVIPSASVREDTDATGVNGVSGNTYKTMNLVNRRAFFVGDRKQIRLESDKNIVNQTFRLVANARYDFQPVHPAGEPVATVGYKG